MYKAEVSCGALMFGMVLTKHSDVIGASRLEGSDHDAEISKCRIGDVGQYIAFVRQK